MAIVMNFLVRKKRDESAEPRLTTSAGSLGGKYALKGKQVEWTSNGETGRYCKGIFAQERPKMKYSDSRRAVKAIDN